MTETATPAIMQAEGELGNPFRIFTSDKFGDVRVTEIDGRPYFRATDVAKALGYATPRKAIFDHCKGVLKRNALSSRGMQSTNFIPESDVYRLIARSKLPAAEEFEKWIFEEVLPSIAHQGGYVAPEVRDAFTISDLPQTPAIAETLYTAQEIKLYLEQHCILSQKKVLTHIYALLVTHGFAYKDKFGYHPTAWANNTGHAAEIVKRISIMGGVEYPKTTIGLTTKGLTRFCKEILKTTDTARQAELIQGARGYE